MSRVTVQQACSTPGCTMVTYTVLAVGDQVPAPRKCVSCATAPAPQAGASEIEGAASTF